MDVEYGTKTWSDQKDQLLIDGDPGSPPTIIASIKAEHWIVVGRTTLGGQHAIEFELADADATSRQLLPATPANLAKLTPPVPSGFRRTATQVRPKGSGAG